MNDAPPSTEPSASLDRAVDMQPREGDVVPLAQLPNGAIAAGGNLASHPRGEPGAPFGGRGVVHAEAIYEHGSVTSHPSDDALALAARRAIEQNGHLTPGLVSVEVRGGLVRLSGTVPTTVERSVAEECVAVLPGVLRVENELRTPHGAD
jgi:hypothetical protein